MAESWHVDESLWARYASGALDSVAEAAVEAHVVRCPVCRATARGQVEPAPALWEAVHLQIARPRSRVGSLLTRCGLDPSDVTVLATGRDLVLAGFVALGAATGCAILVGLLDVRQVLTADLAFLLVAPLVPMLAVVATYDSTDPLRELTSTTPYSLVRLALLRSAAALAAALPVTTAVAAFLPGVTVSAAVWLLPSLLLAVLGLLALTWGTARTAAVATATLWVLVAGAAARNGVLAELGSGTAQLVCLVGLLLAAAALTGRMNALTTPPGVLR